MAKKSNTAPAAFKQTVGAVLKSLRKERKLTQTELAEMLGASYASAVSDLERGNFEVYLYMFFKICRALGEEPVSVLYEIDTALLEAEFWEGDEK